MHLLGKRISLYCWRTRLMSLCIFALLTSSIPVAPTAVAQETIQPFLWTMAQETPDEPVSIIVQKLAVASDRHLEDLVARLGGKVTKALPIINAFGAQIPARTIPALAQAAGIRWVSLDAPVYKMNGPSETSVQVRDDFAANRYDGSDGAPYWSSSWEEIGESDGPDLGDVAITRFLGGALQGLRLQNGAKGIWRQVNLLGAETTTLNFAYRRKGFVDATAYVAVEVSTDGVNWHELDRLTGPATDADVQQIGYDISAYRSATTAIRFVTSAMVTEQAKLYIDQVTIQYTPRTIDYAYQIHLPLIASGTQDSDSISDQPRDSYARAMSSNITYYLHNDPMPAQGPTVAHALLPMTESVPTVAILYNYDKNRNSHAGLELDEGHTGANESVTSKVQRWQLAASTSALQLSGNATLTLYAAMRDFRTDKRAVVDAYLIDRSSSQSTVIANKQISKAALVGGWQALTLDFGLLNYTLPANHQLELAVMVGNNADREMWFAYSTVQYPARLTLGLSCLVCINTTNLASTYVQAINGEQVWNETGYIQGQGISVAVVDSGIAMHDDFKDDAGNSRILARVDFTGNQGSSDDFYGHGTHVAGTIGGNGNMSSGTYIGVAPKVNLVDVKVTNDYGAGNTSDVVAGLQWIYDNKALYNIRIANLSLNNSVPESYHTSPLNAALEILWFNGVVVVVSAGNHGNNGILYPPANDPFVITVGAVDTKGTKSILDDNIALFSDHGITQDGFAKPDLIVPGFDIISALAGDDSNLALDHPSHKVSNTYGNKYFRMSGTSMASAVASGAVALLLQDEPQLTPDQVKYRLTATASPMLLSSYLDIYAAVHGNSTESANTGVTASALLWSGSDPITWGSGSWNSVSWNTVSWNTVSWNTVSWNTVTWNTVHWDE